MSTDTSNSLSVEQLQTLAGDPSQAANQVAALLAVLAQDDDEATGWVTDALQGIETLAPNCTPDLTKSSTNPHAAIAAWACKMLVRVTPSTQEIQQTIVAVLTQHDSLATRQEAALALGQLPQLSPETTTALRTAAGSDNPRLSRLATQALQSTGNS